MGETHIMSSSENRKLGMLNNDDGLSLLDGSKEAHQNIDYWLIYRTCLYYLTILQKKL